MLPAGTVQTRPGRKVGSRNKNTLEFINLYEQYRAKFTCPILALFKIINMKRIDRNIQINAIKTLLPYRFSRQQVDTSDDGAQGELTLVWDNDKIPADLLKEAEQGEDDARQT